MLTRLGVLIVRCIVLFCIAFRRVTTVNLFDCDKRVNYVLNYSRDKIQSYSKQRRILICVSHLFLFKNVGTRILNVQETYQ